MLDVEVIHAVRGLTLSKKLRQERADEVLDDLSELPVERCPAEAPSHRMWDPKTDLTAHDAADVAVAELLDCPLLHQGPAAGPRRLTF